MRRLACCLALVLLTGALPAFSGLTLVVRAGRPCLTVNTCHPIDHCTSASPAGCIPLVPTRSSFIGAQITSFALVAPPPLFSRTAESPDPPPPKLAV